MGRQFSVFRFQISDIRDQRSEVRCQKSESQIIRNLKSEIRHLVIWKTGFTLIEVLVGLSIMALLFGGGYAAFREFARRQQVVQVAGLVRSDLLLAQQKALSGEKPVGCTGNLHGYIVRVQSLSYDVYADCSGASGIIDAGDPLVKFVNLPAGITNTSGTKTILFKVLGQGTNVPTQDTIVLTQSMTGKTTSLVITQTGQVDIVQ